MLFSFVVDAHVPHRSYRLAVCLFLAYDRLVERRQRLVLNRAVQSTAIVSSIFPKSVQDRLLATSQDKQDLVAANHKIKSFLKSDTKENEVSRDTGLMPIADLFPHCTVMFGGE